MRLVIASLLLSGASVAAAGAAEIVGAKELQAGWLDGRLISTSGPRGGKSNFTFRPDGKVVRTGGREGAAREGTWRVDDDGFCMKLGEAKRESCYLAVRAENGALKVMRRTGSAFTWTR